LHRPEEVDTIAVVIDEGLQLGGTWAGEVNYVRKDGTGALGETAVALMFDERGRPTGVHNTNHDITESRRAEEALRQSEKRLAEAQKMAHLGNWEWDLVSDEAIGSAEMLRLLGLEPLQSENRFTIQSFIDCLQPHDREWVQQALAKAVAERGSINYENEIVRADGTIHIIHGLGEVILDDAGQPVKMVGTALDITESKRAEEALRESETRFRALIENGSDGITMLGANGLLTYASDSTQRILGYSPDEVVGHNPMELVHPDDQLAIGNLLFKLIEMPDDIVTTEYRMLHKDGSWRWIESTINNLLAEPAIHALVFNYRDISERRQAGQALEKSQEMFSKAFNASPCAISISNLATGQYISVNDSFIDACGYSREELIGLRGTDLGIWVDLDVRDRVGALLREYGSVHQIEVATRSKSGVVHEVMFSADMIELEGEPCVLSVAVDITERLRSEEELRRSEELFAKAFRASPDAFVITRLRDNTIMDVNDSFSGTTGYSREEVLGIGVAELNIWPDLSARDRMIATLRTEGSVHNFEAFYRKKSGEVGSGLVSSELVQIAGEPCVLTICRDITDRKRAEEAVDFERFLLNSLMESTPDSIYFKDTEGKFTRVNRALAKSVGMSDPAEAVGKTDSDLFSEELARSSLHDEQEILRTGIPILSKEGREVWADGRETWVLTTKMPLRNRHGDITGTFGVSRDITESKQSEEALRNSESKNRALIEAIPDLMIQVNKDGTIIDFGSEKDEKLIMPSDQFIGKTLESILPPEVAQLAIQIVAQTLESGKMQVFEYQMTALSRKQDFEARFVASSQNEVLAIIRNISERKQAQEALTRAKDDLELRVTERTAELSESNEQLQDELVQRQLIEYELQKKEAQLSEAQEIAHIGSWEADLKARDTYWSDELYSIFGVEPQSHAASREAFVEYVHPEDRAAFNNELTRILAEGGSFAIDNRILRSDGSSRVIYTRGKLIADENGQPHRIVGTCQDITELKLAEDKLLQKTSQLQAIFEAFPDLYFILDADGTILDYKAETSGALYMLPEQYLGRQMQDLLPLDVTQQYQEAILQVSTTRSPVGIEYSTTRPDGEHSFEARLVSLREKQVIIIVRDITSRKQTEHLLQESETRYRAIVEDQIEIVSRCLPDGTLTFVNEAHCQFWGYTREELIGVSFLDLMPPEASMHMRKHLASFDIKKPIITHEQRVESSDGSMRWLHWTERALFDEEGHVLEIQSVGSDVTERELAKEAAEAANLAKSEFLSRMSHELRTPLNAIIGFSQLLEMEELDPDQMESVALVHKAGRHLLDLINEVLDISGIEAGRTSLSTEPVSVAEVLEECLDLVKPIAAAKNIMLRSGTVLRSNSYVLADRQRFKQVILNLLSNAVKYNRVGGSLSLSCDGDSESTSDEIAPDRVRIGVSDTGAGIAQEKLKKLFTPFERLDADRTGVEGTGLGLALSKRLAQMMGGDMGVESVVGQGSTFWVELPGAIGPMEQVKGQLTGPLAMPLGPVGGRTVLYIEDNNSNLRLIERIFQQWPDIRLLSAMQGTLGFELARQHGPDLILLDLHLPDVHGERVLEWLRQDPRTMNTPVVIITADATPREAARLLELGANAYITKPIDVKHFVTVIKDSLEGKELINAG
jgi:PAS domain S-box-containing protein